jgi:polysaccharide export outer membrane protein
MIVPLTQAAYAQAVSSEKDLVQYVSDARKAGLSDDQIQKNAVSTGWSQAAVVDAIRAAPSAKSAGSATVPPGVKDPVSNGVKTPPAAATTNEIKSVDRGVPDDYQIGAGDVIQVNVWKEPDASIPTAVVRPDGKISLPLVKEVSVVGLTPKQAETVITAKLGQFINGADVTVVVSEINSKKVYLVGAVKKEGPLAYTYRMSVMQAISEGGGLTDYAKRKKIYVLRTENGRQFRLPFNYDAVLKGERMELNIPLLPGDTVVIPH